MRAPLIAPGRKSPPPRQASAGHTGREAVEITTEIQELARGLRNDPQLIYEFVRNTIEYVPVYGSIKGPTMTWYDGRGNDFDITSLYVALMRASGYTSNYVYGLIRLSPTQISNWLGAGTDPDVLGALLASAGIPASVFVTGTGNLAFVELEHVWAKTNIGGTNYAFDPSFKAHTSSAGMDLATVMGYDQASFLARATAGATVDPNYVQDLNRANMHADLATFAGNLVDHIRTAAHGAKLADVIGGREIVWVRNDSLRTTLTYERARYFEWTEIPTAYDVLVRVQHIGIDQTLVSSAVYGKRFTVVYGAGGAPELRLDGTTVATGSPSTTGSFYPLTVTVDHPYAAFGGTYADQTVTMTVESGGTFAIMNGFAETRRGSVEKHRKVLQQQLFDGDDPASEPVRGETLTVIGNTWLAESAVTVQRLDSIAQTMTIQHHTIGVCGQVESPYVDIPGVLVSVVSTQEDPDDESAVFFALAGLGSTFESGVFEQLQPFSAVCTVKLVDVSSAKGDKIFDATSANYLGTVKPQLVNYSAGEVALVEAYINAGFRLVLPQDGDLNEVDWTGIGFISISPSENSIGHIISGSLAGGYGSEQGDADPGSAGNTGNPGNQSDQHDQSKEPIDLFTGDYLYEHTDITLGSRPYPIGLGFTRSYNSASRLVDGVLGLGWTHSLDVRTRVDTDGFQGLGEDSPVDAAAIIAELFVAQDVLHGSKTALKIALATLSHRWFMERLIENLVVVTGDLDSRRFVRLADGSYNPPPGSADQLTLEADQSFLLRTKYGVVRDFDPAGRLASRSDANGNAVSFTYAGDLLQSVSNAFSRALTFTYTGNRLTQVSDGTGRGVAFGYDVEGNLVSVVDVLGETTTFQYDQPGRLTRVFYPAFPLDAFVTNTFDALGRVATQTDGVGNPYSYYFSGHRAEEIDPLGNPRTLYFDRLGNTLIEVDGTLQETTLTYDGQSRLIRRTQAEGNDALFEYDDRHNLTRSTENPKPPSTEAPLVRTATYEPLFNRLTSETDPRGNVTSYFHDASGNLIRIELPPVNSVVPVVTYTLDGHGQVLTQTDAEGMRRRYSYDASTADLLTFVLDDGGLDLTWQMQYDARGNLVQETDPRGNAWLTAFDARRLPAQSTTPAPFVFDTLYAHDASGNLTAIQRETGDVLDPWQTTSFTYSATNRRLSTTDPQGHTALYQYDPADRLSAVTDAEGHGTAHAYDAAGRLATITDGRGVTIHAETYTANGFRQSIADGEAHATTYEYDPFDRLSRIDYPGGSFEEFTHDSAGNLTRRRTRSGAFIDYTYDSLNRIATKTVPAPAAESVVYTHDLTGRVLGIVGGNGALSYGYDSAGRLIQCTHADGQQVQYAYDAAGNRTRITYPDGYEINYQYDEMDRPTAVIDGAASTLAYLTYDALSRRVQTTYLNGTSSTFAYEKDDDVAQVAHSFTGGSLTLDYTHDAVHNRVTLSDGQRTLAYGYDEADQLITVTASAGVPAAVSFDIDGAGNRSSMSEDATVTTYATNPLNQYTAVGSRTLAYDANGNLASDGLRTFTHDAQNRLQRLLTLRHDVTAGYDALGRRITRTVRSLAPHVRPATGPFVPPLEPPGEIRYVYDQRQVILEYDGGSGAMLRRYVFTPGLDDPIAMQTASGTFYYHMDALGSTVALSDDGGAVIESYSYSAYGELAAPSAVSNPHGFTGQPFDRECGLYYFRARYYDPDLGRFLEPDPIAYLGGLNLYRYVDNNPVNWLDPLGLFKFGKRPLSGLPWIPGASSNPLDDYFNTEISHEHGFFEDAGGGNIGFGPEGRFSEDPTGKGYRYDDKHYDDALMREALKNVKDGEYSLLGWGEPEKNNCQDWADRLREEYQRLEQQRGQQPKK